jgi:hypothetical protein
VYQTTRQGRPGGPTRSVRESSESLNTPNAVPLDAPPDLR